MVELRGFEPLTFSLRTRRATNCATAPSRRRTDARRKDTTGPAALRIHRRLAPRGARAGSGRTLRWVWWTTRWRTTSPGSSTLPSAGSRRIRTPITERWAGCWSSPGACPPHTSRGSRSTGRRSRRPGSCRHPRSVVVTPTRSTPAWRASAARSCPPAPASSSSWSRTPGPASGPPSPPATWWLRADPAAAGSSGCWTGSSGCSTWRTGTRRCTVSSAAPCAACRPRRGVSSGTRPGYSWTRCSGRTRRRPTGVSASCETRVWPPGRRRRSRHSGTGSAARPSPAS